MKPLSPIKRIALIAATLLAISAPAVRAQVASNFPDRPMRIIVPFAAGGPTDAMARLIAQGMSEAFRKNVIVENRPGATGLLGTQAVLNAPRDGYTLLMTTNSAQIMNAIHRKPAPYDPVSDFVPIGRAAQYAIYVVANASAPFNSLKELQTYAKANPKRLVYSSTGNGSVASLACELLAEAAGIEFVHSPYKGTAPAIQAVIANNVDLSCDSIPNAHPHVKSGRLKALALMRNERSSDVPDVPTAREAGFPTLPETYIWLGLLAPAATPPAVVERITSVYQSVLKTADFQNRARAAMYEPVLETPAAFTQAIRAERQRWEAIVKAKGITAD